MRSMGTRMEIRTKARTGIKMRTGAGRAQPQVPRLARAAEARSGRRIRGLSHGRRGGRTKRRGRVGGVGPVRGPPHHGGIKAGRRRQEKRAAERVGCG